MPENESKNTEPEASDVEPVETEPTAAHPAAEPGAAPDAAPAPEQSRRRLPAWATSRTALASLAAAGVFLIGGLSGFAIGHAAGDDDHRMDRFTPVGFRDGGPGFRHGGPDRGPDFRAPDGQLPPSTEGQSQEQSESESQSDSGTSS